MAHVRTQIREALGSLLAGLATTGGRVYASRVYPLEEASLPALLIFSDSETSTPLTINTPRISQRNLQLRIVAVAKATADLDDTLDRICEEVETALANPVAGLELLMRAITLRGTEIEIDGDVDQPTGRATMTWEAEYQTAEDAPDTAL